MPKHEVYFTVETEVSGNTLQKLIDLRAKFLSNRSVIWRDESENEQVKPIPILIISNAWKVEGESDLFRVKLRVIMVTTVDGFVSGGGCSQGDVVHTPALLISLNKAEEAMGAVTTVLRNDTEHPLNLLNNASPTEEEPLVSLSDLKINEERESAPNSL